MSRLVEGLSGLLRRLGWVAVLLLMATALYVSLGRQLMPLVAEYREDIRAQLAVALKQPVAVGAVEGGWRLLRPRVILHDVRIGSGDSPLRLDRVVLVPDLFDSLWQRQPRLSDLWLEGLKLGLEQQPDGSWQLGGFATDSDGAPPDPGRILAGLEQVERLQLVDSQLTVEAQGQPPQTLTYANLELQRTLRGWRLDGRLALPDGQPLTLQARLRATPEHWREARLEAYLSLPQSVWSDWLPDRVGAWRLGQLRAGGDLWLRWERGRLEAAAARLHAPTLTLGRDEAPPASLRDLAATLHLQRTDSGYRLLLDDLAFSEGQTRWGDARVLLEQIAESEALEPRWLLQADRLALGQLAPLAASLLPLPEAGRQALLAMRPRGELSNLSLDYRPQAAPAERLRYAANFAGFGIDAWRGVPKLEGFAGLVEGTLGEGEVRLDAAEVGFQLAQLFPEPWRYRQAQGRLHWARDESGVTLSIPYVQAEGDEGRLAADLFVRLLDDPAAEDYMDLRVGLVEGDARLAGRYLPTRAPGFSPALGAWLQAAVQAGRIEQGYFQYQGALQGSDPASRVLSLYLEVEDAELAFQPGWPALRDAAGVVRLEPSGVDVTLSRGRVLDSQVSDAHAQVPLNTGTPPALQLDAALQSSLGDVLALLQQAPTPAAEIVAGWRGSGALDGRLQLQLPLSGHGTPHVIAEAAATEASLTVARPDLTLEALSGRFRYDTRQGFSAESFTATLFDRPVAGRATSTGNEAAPRTRLFATGQVGVERLANWLGVEQPLPASGLLPYDLTVELAATGSRLQVESSLLGVGIDLPAPFAKAPNVARATRLTLGLDGGSRRLDVAHGELASLAYQAPASALWSGRGELRLGSLDARLPASGLHLSGELPLLELAAWKDTLQRYAPAGDSGEASSRRDWNLPETALQIGRFRGFGLDIERLALTLDAQEQAWQLGLASEALRGQVRVPRAVAEPIALTLTELRLPAVTSEQAAAEPAEPIDPLAGVDPRAVPALDVSIDALYQGEALLGSWSLKARPQADGLALRELSLGLRGLQLSGEGGWLPGRTWYRGQLAGDDVGAVLAAWGFEPSLSSRTFTVEVDGGWPGSPAAFGLARYSGTLTPHFRDGQLRQVEGGAQALRVFGLLNFNAIGRRLRLDFSDLFGRGLSYDTLTGALVADTGRYRTHQPILLDGPSSKLELDGTLDLVDDRIDARLLVTLPVSNNLPLAAIIAGAPAIGGALFIADKLLGDRVARFASVQYRVEGPWQAPEISLAKPFERGEE